MVAIATRPSGAVEEGQCVVIASAIHVDVYCDRRTDGHPSVAAAATRSPDPCEDNRIGCGAAISCGDRRDGAIYANPIVRATTAAVGSAAAAH